MKFHLAGCAGFCAVGQRPCVPEGRALPESLAGVITVTRTEPQPQLCARLHSPALCGREAEEGATVAKDSASMQRLEQMHAQTGQVVVS